MGKLIRTSQYSNNKLQFAVRNLCIYFILGQTGLSLFYIRYRHNYTLVEYQRCMKQWVAASIAGTSRLIQYKSRFIMTLFCAYNLRHNLHKRQGKGSTASQSTQSCCINIPSRSKLQSHPYFLRAKLDALQAESVIHKTNK